MKKPKQPRKPRTALERAKLDIELLKSELVRAKECIEELKRDNVSDSKFYDSRVANLNTDVAARTADLAAIRDQVRSAIHALSETHPKRLPSIFADYFRSHGRTDDTKPEPEILPPTPAELQRQIGVALGHLLATKADTIAAYTPAAYKNTNMDTPF